VKLALVYFGLPRTYKKCVPSHVSFIKSCADIAEVHVLVWEPEDEHEYVTFLKKLYKGSKFKVHQVQWRPEFINKSSSIPSYLLANVFNIKFHCADCVMTIRPDVTLKQRPPLEEAMRYADRNNNIVFRACYLPVSASHSLDRFAKLAASDILLVYKANMVWCEPLQTWERIGNTIMSTARAEDILSELLRNQDKISFYLNYEIPFSWNIRREKENLVSKKIEFLRGLKYMLRYLL
jgi:hypothetical protein